MADDLWRVLVRPAHPEPEQNIVGAMGRDLAFRAKTDAARPSSAPAIWPQHKSASFPSANHL